MSNQPTLSIIIPCYNAGTFLPEAIESVEAYKGPVSYEIVIADDGSTDQTTLNILSDIEKQGHTVLYQENKGPAGARNTAIRKSRGKYLLFLDSDNKIRPAYIAKGVALLDARSDIDIVYGNPNFFGDVNKKREFSTRQFDLVDIFLGNYIDMCSVMRKEVWEKVGGFDEDRALIGYEDWDFWIMAGNAGFRFHFLDEPLFDYRIRTDSLAKQEAGSERVEKLYRYLFMKHLHLLMTNYQALYNQDRFFQADQKRPVRTFFKYLYRRYITRKPVSIANFRAQNSK